MLAREPASFWRENVIAVPVVVAETSYRILEVHSFCNRQRAKPSPIKITALIFQVKNSTGKLSGLNGFFKSRIRSRPSPQI